MLTCLDGSSAADRPFDFVRGHNLSQVLFVSQHEYRDLILLHSGNNVAEEVVYGLVQSLAVRAVHDEHDSVHRSHVVTVQHALHSMKQRHIVVIVTGWRSWSHMPRLSRHGSQY